MSQSHDASYEMHTLHSPTLASPQFQAFNSPPLHIATGFPPPPQVAHYPEQRSEPAYFTAEQTGASYTYQTQHPALEFRSGFSSPGLPPPGTEPPYTSQPSSPMFPPSPYQHKPDGHFPSSPSPASRALPGIRTSLPYDSTKDKDPVPRTPIYTPGALVGPNGPGVHAPGQMGHPNQQPLSVKYKHSAWNCFSSMEACCIGFWCPCMLYSRTRHRLKTAPNSNLNDFSNCNLHCCAFCALAPVSWVLTFLQRTRIRENYRLEGSVCGDCMRAYCCSCCTLIQDEREVMEREDEIRKFAGPGSGVIGGEGYKASTGMNYPR